MKTAIVYVGAAVAEIGGCFAFWGWLRLSKPIWWLLPGVSSLIAFAYLLTLVETEATGRAYAIYGGSTSSLRLSGCGWSKARARIVGTSPALPFV